MKLMAAQMGVLFSPPRGERGVISLASLVEKKRIPTTLKLFELSVAPKFTSSRP
jgi:hypothetical protein